MAQEMAGQDPFAEYLGHFDRLIGDRRTGRTLGEIGGRLTDVTVLTAEDPRTEPLDIILDEVARGAEKAGSVEGQNYYRVADRAEAIQFAVDLARPEDLVIACGKGHEQSMCYGTVETPWSEHQALRDAIRRRLGREQTDSQGR